MQALFTKAERFLIGNNRTFVITTEDSDTAKTITNSKRDRSQELDRATLGPYFDKLFESTGVQLDSESQPARKVALSFRNHDSLSKKRSPPKNKNKSYRTIYRH